MDDTRTHWTLNDMSWRELTLAEHRRRGRGRAAFWILAAAALLVAWW